MAKPLDGIRVIEWAAFHNGPAAGYMLGDLGAEVIKIEEPIKGDPSRGLTQMFGESMVLDGGRLVGFEFANRNKKSMTVNLKSEAGRQIIYKLVEKTDIFYTNYYRDGILQELKMDYETLSKHNPKLIYAINSGYGLEGPVNNERAFDTIGQARSGLMWSVGDRDQNEPYQTVSAPCDQVGATMLAYSLLAALVARERQGIGQQIEVSLLGSAIHMQGIGMNMNLMRHRSYSRHSRERARNPMANHYCCGDDKWIMLAEPQSDRFWGQFCRIMGLEYMEEDPRYATALDRRENFMECNEAVSKAFTTRSRDEWLECFKEEGAEFAHSPIYDYYDVAEDPQALENDYIVNYDHPALGTVKMVGMPTKFSKTPIGIQREAPELGQHTEEVLLEMLDMSWEDIA
ncbi:MAG: CoA transferase, partial [Dehalococcoidia bacterium]|nr:CoA transferase [Dehalococcoidia bacterium]